MFNNNITLLFRLLFCICVSTKMYAQKFAIIGDYGSGDDNEQKVSEMVKSWNPDFIITLGDNNYPEGSASTIDSNIGQFYSDFIYPYYGSFGAGECLCNRFFPSLGNHDADFGNIHAYFDYFTLPGNERYYDFIKGNIHFFVLNSNQSEPDGVKYYSSQARWLREKIMHSHSRWNIVYFHHAPYSSGYQGSSDWMQWPFRTLGIDAVFSGHEHSYERLEIDSLPYFVNGCGGALRRTFVDTLHGSMIRYSGNFGAQLAETFQDSMNISFYNANDSLVDRYVIIHNSHINTSTSGIDINSLGEGFLVYPNPFKNYTTVKFSINEYSFVKLIVYNYAGELLEILKNQYYYPGTYFISWCNDLLPPGTYYIVMTYGNEIRHFFVTKTL